MALLVIMTICQLLIALIHIFEFSKRYGKDFKKQNRNVRNYRAIRRNRNNRQNNNIRDAPPAYPQ